MATANNEALRIAGLMWERRHDFKFGVDVGKVDDILDKAVQAAAQRTGDSLRHPVIISDSGDNPTAGGVGDTPTVAAALISKRIGDAVVQGPVDHVAVETCIKAGVGQEV